jgi:hypothetical protein
MLNPIPRLGEWEKYKKIVKAITKHLEGKKYVGTSMGKKLLCMYKRDMLQMLHTTFQIQEEFEITELKSMWHFADGQEMEKMVKPNIGRWGSVGQAGATFLENWDGWHEMSQSIVNSFNTDVNANTLASWLDTYMTDPGLKAQVIFVVTSTFNGSSSGAICQSEQDSDPCTCHSTATSCDKTCFVFK